MSNILQARKGRARGRPVDAGALRDICALLGEGARRRDHLLEYLHAIQDRYRCISAAHIVALAHELALAPTEVYEVATFYHHFDVVEDDATDAPAVTVRVCESLTCEMFGAEALVEKLNAAVPGNVRVQRVPCVGRCQGAPVAVLGHNPIDRANPDLVLQALADGAVEAPATAHLPFAEYRKIGGYQTLLQCVEGQRTVDDVIDTLKDSRLRGLGGAGFPAGDKWAVVRQQRGPRVVAVNIDEGEPGTFKDRHYLERDPHRFIEGMLIAAWAVEADACYIYLRDEYAGCRRMLARELANLRADPPYRLPTIELRRGAGAYICGEESAMIESIEGKRGMPRLRPPYVAQVGLFGRPTLEHNMETLHWVAEILRRGAAWFASHGRRERSGLRSYSVSGRVAHPGVYLAPAGISVRELIDEYCGGMLPGHEFYGYFPGGASGGILPATLGDLALDFDTLQPYGCFIGSAAVIVLSHQDSARRAALNAMRFFARESCGQCTPCRVGTAKAVLLMEHEQWDQTLLEDLARVMEDASICGLGQAAPNPLRCAIKYFPQEFA